MRAADLPPGSVVAQLSAVAYTRAVGVAPLSLWWVTGSAGLVNGAVVDELLESGDAEVLRVGFGKRRPAASTALRELAMVFEGRLETPVPLPVPPPEAGPSPEPGA